MRVAQLIIFLSLLTNCVSSQDLTKGNLATTISSVNNRSVNLAIERLYLHTDKTIYTTNDTLWFKAYLLDACYLSASVKSGVVYLEIANDSNKVIKRAMLPVYAGIGFGQLFLDEKEMPQGNYILSAYTNWMRNFGEQYMFRKPFSISSISSKEWLINYSAAVTRNAGNENVQLNLNINQFDSVPVRYTKLSLAVTDKKRTLIKEEMETAGDGSLKINFNLPEQPNAENISVRLQQNKNQRDHKLVVPLILNRPEYIDLQFMPEGGSFVAGIPSKIAFKALNEDGYGADVSGTIVDGKGREVATFKSSHKGIGAFEITPDASEKYFAKLNLPDGSAKMYVLPEVAKSGLTLQVRNELESDSCEVIIHASPDIISTENNFFLIAQARGLVCYGASFVTKAKGVKYKVDKKTFPTGIVRFTLSGADKRVINERIIFVDHGDNLELQVSRNKSIYRQRDSVILNIKVSDKNGEPVAGSFSLSITDDTQVKTDSNDTHSIFSQLMLTGEVRGNVETPGYYLQSPRTVNRWQELDQLLLAQGWVGYDWNKMLNAPMNFHHQPEKQYLLKGRVLNAFNKPVPGAPVTLLSQSPFMIEDTVTNTEGQFIFNSVVPADTAVFFLQSKNKRNKSFNVGIELEEFSPYIFTLSRQRLTPWNVNITASRLAFVNKQIELREAMERITGVKTLQEVFVTAKRIVKDSKNLNGPGEADLIVTEEELEKAGRTTLGQLLEKKLSGFAVKADKRGVQYYALLTMRVHLIIDGMNTEFFLSEGESLYHHLKTFFDYYDAEEIKGIEVMMSGKYQMRYTSTFLGPFDTPWDHAFIEVTTRGGKGPFLKKMVGTYLHRPVPFVVPRQFYVPKYPVGSTPDMTDTRSTIFWEPHIVTDKNGLATVSFYTADNPARYTIILEGSNMDGNIGTFRGGMIVAAEK